jgi:N utilization substance protein B
VIEQFVRHRLGPNDADEGYPEGRVPEADVKLFARLVRAAASNIETIDAALDAVLSKEWPLQKLDPVLRALLRAAGAELMAPHDPPMRVVINEYLDIAHGFFVGDEPKFANGVLEALARRFRADEFTRPG